MDSLVKAVTGFNEEVQFLVGILYHICMQLHSMIHSKRSLRRRSRSEHQTLGFEMCPDHTLVSCLDGMCSASLVEALGWLEFFRNMIWTWCALHQSNVAGATGSPPEVTCTLPRNDQVKCFKPTPVRTLEYLKGKHMIVSLCSSKTYTLESSVSNKYNYLSEDFIQSFLQ